ncbi:hypothetical protein DFS34DRAFT_654395 [Phlyctochytrium arcticum]|nr:hypothetical protein DFS34DRAFT_654395 [Phlyctochytrium arcticum]
MGGRSCDALHATKLRRTFQNDIAKAIVAVCRPGIPTRRTTIKGSILGGRERAAMDLLDGDSSGLMDASAFDTSFTDLSASLSGLSLAPDSMLPRTPIKFGKGERPGQPKRRESIALFRAIAGVDAMDDMEKPYFLMDDAPSPTLSPRSSTPDFPEFRVASASRPFNIRQSPTLSPQRSPRATPKHSSPLRDGTMASRPKPTSQLSSNVDMLPSESVSRSRTSSSASSGTGSPMNKSPSTVRPPKSADCATPNLSKRHSMIADSATPNLSKRHSMIALGHSSSLMAEDPKFRKSPLQSFATAETHVSTPPSLRRANSSNTLGATSSQKVAPSPSTLHVRSQRSQISTPPVARPSYTTPIPHQPSCGTCGSSTPVFKFNAAGTASPHSTTASPRKNMTPTRSKVTTKGRTSVSAKKPPRQQSIRPELNIDVTIGVPPAVEPIYGISECGGYNSTSTTLNSDLNDHPMICSPNVTINAVTPMSNTSRRSHFNLSPSHSMFTPTATPPTQTLEHRASLSNLPRPSPTKIPTTSSTLENKRKLGEKFDASPAADQSRLKYSRGTTRLPMPSFGVAPPSSGGRSAIAVPSRIARSGIPSTSSTSTSTPLSSASQRTPDSNSATRLRPTAGSRAAARPSSLWVGRY